MYRRSSLPDTLDRVITCRHVGKIAKLFCSTRMSKILVTCWRGNVVIMSNWAVIVFEVRPHWEPELQRQFDGEQVRIRACRSLVDVARTLTSDFERVEGQMGSLAIIDLSAGLAKCLQFLGRLHQQGRTWPVIVIGSVQNSNLEWPIRELGVLDWLFDTISGEELARLCRRQFQPASTRTRGPEEQSRDR